MTPERLNQILHELQDFQSKEEARIESLYEGGLILDKTPEGEDDGIYLRNLDYGVSYLTAVVKRYDTEGGG